MSQMLTNSRGDILPVRPRYMGASGIYAVLSVGELPSTVFIRGFDRRIEVRTIETDQETLVTGMKRMPMRGTLEGSVKARSYARAQDSLDALSEFLAYTPLRFRRRSEDDFYLEIFPEGLNDAQTRKGSILEFSIPMIAPKPVWLRDTPTVFSRTLTGNATITVVNGGTAEVKPIIRLRSGILPSGGSQALTLQNYTTGSVLAYQSPMINNQQLVIDNEAMTARLDGVGVLGDMLPIWLHQGFILAPGANEMHVSVMGAGTPAQLEIEFQERML